MTFDIGTPGERQLKGTPSQPSRAAWRTTIRGDADRPSLGRKGFLAPAPSNKAGAATPFVVVSPSVLMGYVPRNGGGRLTVETLSALVEELRIASLRRSASDGVPADITLEWDVADTLAALDLMLEDAILAGGPVGAFAQRVVAMLLAGAVVAYAADLSRE